MSYDAHDIIAAIASAPGGAARGIVRLSGPCAIDCLAESFSSNDSTAWTSITQPCRISGVMRVAGDADTSPLTIPGALFVWPGTRSYTREPAAEFHTLGSPPLLAAVLDELCQHGARPAAPGEFTLRAFLAGRIDLTQAEAVLGVVNARTRDDLDGALDQLAGGLSRPLDRIRNDLLNVLAELEAGLDFADEPIEFIGRGDLLGRVAAARQVVAETLTQLDGRRRVGDLPRVALIGAPNVGKSSLFNALVERFGTGALVRSLVAPTPGATRDYVVAALELGGAVCELVDVAGDDVDAADALQWAAQAASTEQRRRADLRLRCVASDDAAGLDEALQRRGDGELVVATKCDLAPGARRGSIRCSSVTGAGLDELADAVRRRLATLAGEGGGAAATAARCAGSLHDAERALDAAAALVRGGDDELVAAEIRGALQAIGEVVGAVCADDVLDRVFSQFCIGK